MSASSIAWGSATVLVCAAVVALALSVRNLREARSELAEMRRLSHERVERNAVLSHEIRTPLALILGPTEMLLEETPGPLTVQQRRFAETIHANARHLQAISEDILTQSRIEAGMFTLQLERVNLRTLGMRAVSELRSLHSLPIAFDCPGAPPTVDGDPRLLLQALTNLLTNACRNSLGNTVTLRIQLQNSQTLISVDDLGIGMNWAKRKKLFTPFWTTSSAQGGVGLGMLITREIVRMHGGKLHIQSTPGLGTTFMFAIPSPEQVGSE